MKDKKDNSEVTRSSTNDHVQSLINARPSKGATKAKQFGSTANDCNEQKQGKSNPSIDV